MNCNNHMYFVLGAVFGMIFFYIIYYLSNKMIR